MIFFTENQLLAHCVFSSDSPPSQQNEKSKEFFGDMVSQKNDGKKKDEKDGEKKEKDSESNSTEKIDDDDGKPECYYGTIKYVGQKCMGAESEKLPNVKIQREKIRPLLEKPLKEDEVYFLIATKWLENWKRYVRYGSAGAVPSGRPDDIISDFDNDRADPSEEGEVELPGGENPGPIDNKELVANWEEFESSPDIEFVILQKGLSEHGDYEFIPESVWNSLVEWFGGKHFGGYAPSIARWARTDGSYYRTEVMVDMHPFVVKCGKFDSTVKPQEMVSPELKKFFLGASMKVEDVFLVFKKELYSKEDRKKYEFRLWEAYMGNPYKHQSFMSTKLQHVLTSAYGSETKKRDFLIETKITSEKEWHLDFVKNYLEKKRAQSRGRTSYDDTGVGYTRTSTYGYGSSSYSYNSDYFRTNSGNNHKPNVVGCCGLGNLGNTCFMNSALQCLTKTEVIKDYFITGAYRGDINEDNPLGAKGKLAESFGNLMELMWNGDHSSVTPREFKYNIGKFAPQFSGYQQQDSAELVAFLLDGLHEDLNLVRKKPVTSIIEGSGRPNHEVADESWDNHLKRNRSVVVNRFQGQFRSEVQCPKCDRISVTFDPFMYLSVPIPLAQQKSTIENVFYVPYLNSSPITQYKIKMSKYVGFEDLKDTFVEEYLPRKLGGKVGDVEMVDEGEEKIKEVDPQDCIVTDVFSKKIYRYYENIQQVSKISKNDKTYIYDIGTKLCRPGRKLMCIGQVNLKTKIPRGETIIKRTSYGTTYRSYSGGEKDLFEYPYLFATPEPEKEPKVNKEGIKTEKMVYKKEIHVDSKDVYEKCLAICRRFIKTEMLQELKEKHGIDLNDPRTCFPFGEDEGEIRGQQPAAANPIADVAAADQDPLAVDQVDALNPQPAAVVADPPAEKPKKPEGAAKYLFKVTMKETSGYSSMYRKIFYDEGDLCIKPPERKSYYYSHVSSSSNDYEHFKFNVYIPRILLDYCDKETFEVVKDEKSMSSEKSEKVSSASKDGITIQKCINLFCQKEQLGKNDTWYCSQCKEHVHAYKKMDLWRLPEILVIQIKRFQASGWYRDKLDTLVDYPMELDLSEDLLNLKNSFSKYELYAVSNHFGNLGGGHYTAYAKVEDQWYEFDDSHTSSTRADNVVSRSGYVLFYVAKNSLKGKDVCEDAKKRNPEEEKKEGEGDPMDIEENKAEAKEDKDVDMKEKGDSVAAEAAEGGESSEVARDKDGDVEMKD